MNLTLVRHLWGVDHTHGLNHYLPRWRDVGYEAVEGSIEFSPNRPAMEQFLKTSGFRFISQILSNEFTPAGTVREHLDSLKRQLDENMPFEPWFFSAHSGSDAWSFNEAVDFYGAALELEKSLGIPISHETHRKRYFNTPWNTRSILEQFPDLKLTCDFSHWVCIAERLLPDCEDIIRLAADHCFYHHARVGHEQGPQVSDPRAPEWEGHLATHERWWDMIWASQQKRGFSETPLAPEFGPAPYMPLLPYTQAPVADLADICDWVARRQADRFAQL